MSQQRQCSQEMQLAAKASRRIVLPIEREQYAAVVQDGSAFQAWVDTNRQHYPELFPADMREGYQLHHLRSSRKLPEMQVRRIRLKQSGKPIPEDTAIEVLQV